MAESSSLTLYRHLLEQLAHVRARHGGAESPEEDALLERMDEAWKGLDRAERELLVWQPSTERLP